jgi:hypothetical protein
VNIAGWIAFLTPVAIAWAASWIAVPSIRELRRKTGDRSLLTYVLGYCWLERSTRTSTTDD